LLTACNTAPKVEVDTQLRRDVEVTQPRRICVTAALEDLAARKRAERGVVEALQARGMDAVPWTELFFIGEDYDDDQLRSTLGEHDVDAVLALEVKRMWTDEKVVPTTATTGGYYGRGWDHYHYSGWQTTYVNGGYTVALPRALYEARLIRCADREVVWLASFRVEGDSSKNWLDLQRAAGERLVPALAGDGLLPASPEGQ
jgi:hypothetical protein